jgi:hypothetical protein
MSLDALLAVADAIKAVLASEAAQVPVPPAPATPQHQSKSATPVHAPQSKADVPGAGGGPQSQSTADAPDADGGPQSKAGAPGADNGHKRRRRPHHKHAAKGAAAATN